MTHAVIHNTVEVNWDKIPHESMLLIFQRHRAQIRALRIFTCGSMPHGWDLLAPYFSQSTEWPNLTELWVYGDRCRPISGLMLQIPGVDSSFHYCRKERDVLTWYAPMHQITTLRLRYDPVDQCLYLLFHCPNLIEFHCDYPTDWDPPIFSPEVICSPSRTPKTVPNLRIFHWRSYREDWTWFLFSSVRFPNLEWLSWGVGFAILRGHAIDNVLINEFMPSLSYITTLDWGVSAPPYTCFTQLFSRTDLSSLQRLHLDFDDYSASDPEIVSWLEALTIDQRRADCFLPRLKTFCIRYLKGQKIFKALYNCLQSRRLEDDDGTLRMSQDNNRSFETLTWESSPVLVELSIDEFMDYVDCALRINFFTWSIQLNSLEDLIWMRFRN